MKQLLVAIASYSVSQKNSHIKSFNSHPNQQRLTRMQKYGANHNPSDQTMFYRADHLHYLQVEYI